MYSTATAGLRLPRGVVQHCERLRGGVHGGAEVRAAEGVRAGGGADAHVDAHGGLDLRRGGEWAVQRNFYLRTWNCPFKTWS